MTRHLFLGLISVLSIASVSQAQSASAEFKGQIVSRESCKDGGVFSKDVCKRIPLGRSRDCTVSLASNVLGQTTVKLSSPAWVATGDLKKEILKGSLGKPYAYTQGFVAHIVKLDHKTSAEVKISNSRTEVLDTYIYTNHVIKKDSQGQTTRTFNQYRCTNLKRVR